MNMDKNLPSRHQSLFVRLEITNKPGMLGEVLKRISLSGGLVSSMQIITASPEIVVRDFFIGINESRQEELINTIRCTTGIKILTVMDAVLLAHQGGKLETTPKLPLRTQEDLSVFYTPGVAKVCLAIADSPKKVFDYTIKQNTVAIVTDGTAILGLGDLGPEAALPVMEGKAMLFKTFGNVDAFPICLATNNTDEIVETVKRIAPVFGGINLEDISAPRCFEIEERLRRELDIPVFHDDQHGTAVVVFAALTNALKVVGKKLDDLKIVVNGVGAAGTAVTKMLLAGGAKNIIGCDHRGIIYNGRKENMNPVKIWYAENTNPENIRGGLRDALRGADLFIGVSAPQVLTAEDVKTMAPEPIVFALANPVPEIMPEEAATVAKVVATGRSDFPNQINNVLCFPGLFRGVLDARAKTINEEMKLAAAQAIASMVLPTELHADYIIPNVFHKGVADAVAKAVYKAAHQTGVARKF
jgi:malate dehydrogenase (oxaloacetate-decarboxylating)